jgi:hypothetical protein
MPAFQDAAYPQETGEAFIALIVIDHASLADPIYLTDAGGTYDPVLDTYILTVGADDYICAPIEIIPPGQSDEEPRGTLRVPNVDQRIGEAIESISGAATCTVTIVLESDPTEVMAGPYQLLELRNIRGDAMTLEGSLVWPSLTVEPWPWDWIRPAKFRAAFRALA